MNRCRGCSSLYPLNILERTVEEGKRDGFNLGYSVSMAIWCRGWWPRVKLRFARAPCTISALKNSLRDISFGFETNGSV